MDMSDKVINIQNPIPILSQPKSVITTNVLIPNKQQEIEYIVTDTIEKDKMDRENNEIKSMGIKYTSFATIHNKISNSILGVLTELFVIPEDMTIFEHIINVFTKEQRYAYIGVFLVILSLIFYVIRLSINEISNRNM